MTERGNTLTFRSDKGEVWNAIYKFDGGGKSLRLNQAMYLKQ
jgi:hypothetical protein